MKIIPKSHTQEARVRRCELHDRQFIDVRVFYLADDGAMMPTSKGVTLEIDKPLAIARAIEAVARQEKVDG